MQQTFETIDELGSTKNNSSSYVIHKVGNVGTFVQLRERNWKVTNGVKVYTNLHCYALN